MISSRNQHKVGIYCRLSKDDDKIGESTSITNQKNMLTDYVKEQNWLLVDIYIDDGYSGTNFNRPNFQRMLQDIEDKKIDCVLVKDQSRLGRNYIEVGNYTKYYFPKHNVRYIALSDGIDSASLQDMDIAPFKNIMNEFYAKDTSKKIKAANRTIAKNGGHKTVWPPLGYKKIQTTIFNLLSMKKRLGLFN
ncbi:recombinase family protein [Coprobacillaceae bacterium CR2/5/TPMF4]|nr:recombinase family protein [Coprobacillaceae bacterium CR2/5/TPMF4]